jgi:hypothetical protein
VELTVAEELPGKGLLGWLGRQVGYVRRAVKGDVSRRTVYRQQRVDEATLPDDPKVKLRRTTIDEVIVDRQPEGGDESAPRHDPRHDSPARPSRGDGRD